ncbi:MAG: peptide deformylase, partial [Bacillota bacterium]|nr:peptide deformylase [Bacillota bacterium]
MAIRIIRTDDDPILRKKSRDVTDINRRVHILLDDM